MTATSRLERVDTLKVRDARDVEDVVRAATQCRAWLVALFKAVDRVGLEKFAAVIRSADATEATALVRRAIMGC